MVLAVLLVAGFSYRWTYYYNFGLKDLAMQAPVQSIAIGALELIRTPREAGRSLLIVGLPMAALGLLLALARELAARHPGVAAKWPWRMLLGLVLDNALLADIARAIVLIYAAYWAGSEAGLQKFLAHVAESPDNPLPRVTVALSDKARDGTHAIACTAADWSGTAARPALPQPVVGSPHTLAAFREGLACNAKGTHSWRLLYRDEKFTYLFATGAGVTRPTTIILPSADPYFLILQGPEGHEGITSK